MTTETFPEEERERIANNLAELRIVAIEIRNLGRRAFDLLGEAQRGGVEDPASLASRFDETAEQIERAARRLRDGAQFIANAAATPKPKAKPSGPHPVFAPILDGIKIASAMKIAAATGNGESPGNLTDRR